MLKTLKQIWFHRRKDSTWRSGQVSVHLGKTGLSGNLAWRVGGNPTVGVGLELRSFGDDLVVLDLGLGVGRLFLGWAGRSLPGWLDRHVRAVPHRYGVEYAVRLQYCPDPEEERDPLVLRWNLGLDPDAWTSREPAWQRGHLSLYRVLFGPETREVLSTVQQDVQLPLPEGPWPATVRLEHVRFSRPRHPKTWQYRTADVRFPEVETGDPKRGPLMGIVRSARSVGEAIGQVVGAILEDRAANGLRPDGTREGTSI